MKRIAVALLVGAVVLLCLAAAQGQDARGQRGPRIGYAFPGGGQVGTEFEIAVGGQGLEGATGVRVSGAGVEMQVTGLKRPMNGKRFQEMQDKLAELRKQMQSARAAGEGAARGGMTFMEKAADLGVSEEELEAFQMTREQRRDPKRQLNPQLVESLVVKVRVATNAVPGPRELRVVTKAGLSNPLRFEVGTLREVRETEPNQPTAQKLAGPFPVVVNGQVLPGDVDRFSFEGKKGESLVVKVVARDLVPYLADAVPGWFQATVTLFDDAGREVAGADDYRFRPDPALHLHLPRDGTYTVEIHDALYRGREDFVYRLMLGPVPVVTGVFPLGGPAGKAVSVALEGWDLPRASFVMPPVAEAGVRPVPVPGNAGEQVMFETDVLPEVVEREESGGGRITLAAPCVVNGRMDRAGDHDVFLVKLPPGSELVAEVVARRLGSPLDAQLILTDTSGAPLATNDDCEDKGDGLNTHHADSWLTAKVPANGMCHLEIRDAQGKGGPSYGYRLRVGPPRPDFALRVTPSCVNARAGLVVPLTVHAVRRDGFKGPITVRVAPGSPGFALDGAVIPAGQDSVRTTLMVPEDLTPGVMPVRFEGVARMGEREVVHEVVPAEDMVQAFFNHHLVPTRNFLVCVTAPRWGKPGPSAAADRRSPLASVRPVSPEPVQLVPGGTARVRFVTTRFGRPEGVNITLDAPPEGVTLATVNWDERGFEAVLKTEADKVKSGQSGNLIFEVTTERVPRDKDGKPGKGAKQRAVVGVLPAVPFTLAATAP